jgi:hypothetical protein
MGGLEGGAISPRIWQATDILVAMHMSGYGTECPFLRDAKFVSC